MISPPSTAELLAMVRDLQERVLVLEAHSVGSVATPRRGPYQSHSATSRRAAERNAPRNGTQRHDVLNLVVLRGDHGATREEVGISLGMSHNSARPRITELMEDGYLVATERTRPTSLGEDAEVLVASEKGREYILKIEETRSAVTPGATQAVVGDQSLFSTQPGFDEIIPPRRPQNAINDDLAA